MFDFEADVPLRMFGDVMSIFQLFYCTNYPSFLLTFETTVSYSGPFSNAAISVSNPLLTNQGSQKSKGWRKVMFHQNERISMSLLTFNSKSRAGIGSGTTFLYSL